MAGFGGFPGTIASIAEYNLLGQIIGAALGPLTTEITLQLNAATQLNPLSPADLALAVVRNEIDEQAAAGEAAQSGINAGRFHTLTRLTGDAPAPEAMAVALRRGFVDDATYLRGIRQGRLRDEWGDLIKQLATADPSPVTALLAYLKGQLDHDTAKGLYGHFGGNPEHFDLSYNVEGAGPSPLEAAEAARRGIIGWDGVGAGVTSFEQAVHESAYRNKWLGVFRALAEYLPPPRTITAMYREGSLDHAKAAELLTKQGVPPDLIDAYLRSGSAQKTQAHKDLALSTVTDLYRNRLVTRTAAEPMIEALGYDATETGFILAIEDLRLEAHYLTLAVSRVHSLYIGHKIDRALALSTLGRLKIDATEAADLVTIWEWERAANVKPLTPAEIAGAMHYQIVDQAAAQALLVELGYTPHDAWVYLSVHEKAAGGLPNEPAGGALTPPPTP